MIRKIGLVLFVSILLVACSNNKDEAWKPNNPQNTTSLMKMYALQDNYEGFKSLFMNGTDAEGTKASFNQLKGIATSGAGINSFTLLTFDSGEMVLVHLTPIPNQEDEVLIQDVIKVPEEMRVFFQQAITPLSSTTSNDSLIK